MYRRIVATLLVSIVTLATICAVAEVATPAAALTATPAAALTGVFIPTLTGPTTGTIGQTLQYYVTVQECERDAAGKDTNCIPAPGVGVPFQVVNSAGASVGIYASQTDAQGQATAAIPFPLPGQYQVRILGFWGIGSPSTYVNISAGNTPTPTPSTTSPSGGSPSGGSSGNGSSGGGILPVVQLPAVQLPALPGSAAGSSAADSTWVWLLTIAIILLFAIIAAVLLTRRRGQDEYDREGSYRRERRYRR